MYILICAIKFMKILKFFKTRMENLIWTWSGRKCIDWHLPCALELLIFLSRTVPSTENYGYLTIQAFLTLFTNKEKTVFFIVWCKGKITNFLHRFIFTYKNAFVTSRFSFKRPFHISKFLIFLMLICQSLFYFFS